MINLIVKQTQNGDLEMELAGSDEEITKMLITAMVQSTDLPLIILATIPSYLDIIGKSRDSFCNVLMKSAGADEKDKEKIINHIISKGGKIQYGE